MNDDDRRKLRSEAGKLIAMSIRERTPENAIHSLLKLSEACLGAAAYIVRGNPVNETCDEILKGCGFEVAEPERKDR